MKGVAEFFKIAAYTVLFGVILVIIFVRAPQASGVSGGEQASQIILSTTKGWADVIRAVTGD